MPATIVYPYSSPASFGPGASPSPLPTFPGGGLVPCNAPEYDIDALLAVIEAGYPEEYVAPMKANPNAGYELLRMMAAVGARCSMAVERFECGAFFMHAQGGAKATTSVEFLRETADAGAVTVLAGTIVTTSTGDRRFVVLEDAVFGALDLGPISVAVEAVFEGYEWNVPGQVITPAGEVLPGEIDTVVRFQLSPAFGDATIQVRQILSAEGGRAPMLDGLASNRGMPRLPGEADGPYRLRATSLPDTVSPGAMVRTVQQRLGLLGIEFDFIETFDVRYQTCFDAPSPNPGTPSAYLNGTPPTNPLYDDTLFVYDDPRAVTRFSNRWLDVVEQRRAFIVVLRNVGVVLDVGFAYDDPGLGPTDFTTRGTPAYDGRLTDNPALISPAAFDGFDFGLQTIMAGLYDDLQRVKPAGVVAIIETLRP